MTLLLLLIACRMDDPVQRRPSGPPTTEDTGLPTSSHSDTAWWTDTGGVDDSGTGDFPMHGRMGPLRIPLEDLPWDIEPPVFLQGFEVPLTRDTGLLITADDHDGDGALSVVDCDDQDPQVYPGAAERCDGVDTDCDPTTTEAGMVSLNATRQGADLDAVLLMAEPGDTVALCSGDWEAVTLSGVHLVGHGDPQLGGVVVEQGGWLQGVGVGLLASTDPVFLVRAGAMLDAHDVAITGDVLAERYTRLRLVDSTVDGHVVLTGTNLEVVDSTFEVSSGFSLVYLGRDVPPHLLDFTISGSHFVGGVSVGGGDGVLRDSVVVGLADEKEALGWFDGRVYLAGVSVNGVGEDGVRLFTAHAVADAWTVIEGSHVGVLMEGQSSWSGGVVRSNEVGLQVQGEGSFRVTEALVTSNGLGAEVNDEAALLLRHQELRTNDTDATVEFRSLLALRDVGVDSVVIDGSTQLYSDRVDADCQAQACTPVVPSAGVTLSREPMAAAYGHRLWSGSGDWIWWIDDRGEWLFMRWDGADWADVASPVPPHPYGGLLAIFYPDAEVQVWTEGLTGWEAGDRASTEGEVYPIYQSFDVTWGFGDGLLVVVNHYAQELQAWTLDTSGDLAPVLTPSQFLAGSFADDSTGTQVVVSDGRVTISTDTLQGFGGGAVMVLPDLQSAPLVFAIDEGASVRVQPGFAWRGSELLMSSAFGDLVRVRSVGAW